MQVRKFEAATIQEALDHVKRELGPEAIILQTKKNRKGFGLLSKGSVEITAAVSDRSLQKKQYVETRIAESNKEIVRKLPAERQANLLDKYMDRRVAKAAETVDSVEVGGRQKRITATRYVDIDNEASLDSDRNSQFAGSPVASPAASSVKVTDSARKSGFPAGAQPVVQSQDSNVNTQSSVLASNHASLEEEVRALREIVQTLRNSHDQQPASTASTRLWDSMTLDHPVLQEVFDRLVVNGVDRRYAYSMVKKIAFDIGTEKCKDPEVLIDSVANEMMDSIDVSSLSKIRPLKLALVGPTGVGKTATVAKLAGEAKIKGTSKIGLINLDTDKVYAFEQLGTYAKVLNLPFRSASSLEDLKAAMSDFESMDLVIVDTPGRPQKDPAALYELQGILNGIPNLMVDLVLSVVTRDSELHDAVQRYSIFHPQGLIFSKLDETKLYGSIYNVAQKSNLPLHYFTTGQKIPHDIEEATAERVTSLILHL